VAKLLATRIMVVSGAVWCWSWYTMYLEIFRWKHVTRTLRFNPGPPHPIYGRPKLGIPLLVLFACFGTAPVVFSVVSLRWLVEQRHRWQLTGGRAIDEGGVGF
jgi:hypothetical protein